MPVDTFVRRFNVPLVLERQVTEGGKDYVLQHVSILPGRVAGQAFRICDLFAAASVDGQHVIRLNDDSLALRTDCLWAPVQDLRRAQRSMEQDYPEDVASVVKDLRKADKRLAAGIHTCWRKPEHLAIARPPVLPCHPTVSLPYRRDFFLD